VNDRKTTTVPPVDFHAAQDAWAAERGLQPSRSSSTCPRKAITGAHCLSTGRGNRFQDPTAGGRHVACVCQFRGVLKLSDHVRQWWDAERRHMVWTTEPYFPEAAWVDETTRALATHGIEFTDAGEGPWGPGTTLLVAGAPGTWETLQTRAGAAAPPVNRDTTCPWCLREFVGLRGLRIHLSSPGDLDCKHVSRLLGVIPALNG